MLLLDFSFKKTCHTFTSQMSLIFFWHKLILFFSKVILLARLVAGLLF